MEALLVGSHTYAESDQTLAWFGEGPVSKKPVYVFTSRSLPLAGSNATLTDASPQHFVAELDERGVAQAGLLSGPTLLSSFRTAGLVTGYLLGIIPVLLGGGGRRFLPPCPPENLRLTDSKVWPNGVAQLRYDVIRSWSEEVVALEVRGLRNADVFLRLVTGRAVDRPGSGWRWGRRGGGPS